MTHLKSFYLIFLLFYVVQWINWFIKKMIFEFNQHWRCLLEGTTDHCEKRVTDSQLNKPILFINLDPKWKLKLGLQPMSDWSVVTQQGKCWSAALSGSREHLHNTSWLPSHLHFPPFFPPFWFWASSKHSKLLKISTSLSVFFLFVLFLSLLAAMTLWLLCLFGLCVCVQVYNPSPFYFLCRSLNTPRLSHCACLCVCVSFSAPDLESHLSQDSW